MSEKNKLLSSLSLLVTFSQYCTVHSSAQLIDVFYYTIHATATLNCFVCVEFQIFVCEFEWNCFARIEDSSEF